MATNGLFRFTIGQGANDDGYIRSLPPNTGFADTERIAFPDFTRSYLSSDGDSVDFRQWYNHRVLQLGAKGKIVRASDAGVARLCGQRASCPLIAAAKCARPP